MLLLILRLLKISIVSNTKICIVSNACFLFFFLLKDDLSYNQTANQKNTYNNLEKQHKASFAVDRNTTTCMSTNPIGTNSPLQDVWWKVDLAGYYSIDSINIIFRSYSNAGRYFATLSFLAFTI